VLKKIGWRETKYASWCPSLVKQRKRMEVGKNSSRKGDFQRNFRLRKRGQRGREEGRGEIQWKNSGE